MAAQHNMETAIEAPKRGRRGLIAAAAALAAGMLATKGTQSVAASTVSGEYFVAYGTAETGVSTNTGTFYIGVSGKGGGYGLYGVSANGNGVYGESTTANAIVGVSSASATYGQAAVVGLGNASGIGVRAASNGGIALAAEVAAGSTSAVVSILHKGSGPGIVLYAPQNHGIVASTANAGFGGFNGNAVAAGAAGVIGTGSNGAYAGYFTGPVLVNGAQVATGTKSAAVPHPDGTHRLLYCVESPEAWFEDFGEGTITGGKGEVKLDPDFAAVVDTRTLHVFPVAHDEGHHLAVKARSGGSFTVAAGVSSEAAARGVKAADVHGTFSYRVVAKRKDVKAERLAKYPLPTFAPPSALTHPPLPPDPPTFKGR